MKNFALGLLLAISSVIAVAQQPSLTPNIGLEIPAAGSQNWNSPLNFNFNQLDQMLAGLQVLPALDVASLTTWQNNITYGAGAVVWYQGSVYNSKSAGNIANLPTNTTYWGAGSGSAFPTATLAGQTLATNAAGNAYFASQQCVDAALYTGADIGVKVVAALAALPTYTDLNGQVWAMGCVRIPWTQAPQSWSANAVINSPYVSIIADPGSHFYFTGSGDMILIQYTSFPAGVHQNQPQIGPQVTNLTVLNQSATAISGLHLIDVYSAVLKNNHFTSFNGTGGSGGGICNTASEPAAYGIWIENYNYYSEYDVLDNSGGYDDCIGLRVNIKSGGSPSNSFAYMNMINANFGTRSNEIGISIENGTWLYNAYINAEIEGNNANSIGLQLSGNGTLGSSNGGQGGLSFLDLRGECVGCSGPMTMLNMTGTSNLGATGYMGFLAGTGSVSNTSTGTYNWQGSSGVNASTSYNTWYTDGSYRQIFSGALANLFNSVTWRIGNGANIGWSNAPGTTANYLGISPKTGGSTTLCVNQGVNGACSGNIEETNDTVDGNLSVGGLLNNYNGLATAGSGVTPVVSTYSTSRTTSISSQAILGSVNASDASAMLEARCSLTPSSGGGSVVGTISYTDNHSNTQTMAIPSASGTAQQQATFTMTPVAASSVNVTTTVTGTLTYDLNCAVIQIRY